MIQMSCVTVVQRAREEGCTSLTHERKYYEYYHEDGSGVIIKRNLTPSEYSIGTDGAISYPINAKERLENEVMAMAYIREHLPEIPVPPVRCSFEDHGRFYIFFDYVEGIKMSELPESKKPLVIEELDRYFAILKTQKSKELRSFVEKICLPRRLHDLLVKQGSYPSLSKISSKAEEFVLCHNDFTQQNVIVDKETFKVKAILGWEYAGFYPAQIDRSYYHRTGPSTALEEFGEVDDTGEVVQLLRSLKVWPSE
jgi:serine/threonine protein kinase